MNDTKRGVGRLLAGPRNTNHALLGMLLPINAKNPEAHILRGPQGSRFVVRFICLREPYGLVWRSANDKSGNRAASNIVRTLFFRPGSVPGTPITLVFDRRPVKAFGGFGSGSF
jgi:hypothetical protein